MFRNYLKTAWRSLIRNKVYSFINIGGLSVGIAVCLLITLYVTHEYSYDSFHKNADRMYSVYGKFLMGDKGDSLEFRGMSYMTGPAMMKADPSMESFVRTANFRPVVVQDPASPEKKFEEEFLFADANFFNFYSFQLKEGNSANVLSKPFSVVITEEAAEKYFGNSNPVGHLLKYDSAYTFEITGVAKRSPSNSTMTYDFVASLSSIESMTEQKRIVEDQGISFGQLTTMLLLKKGAEPRNTEAVLKKLVGVNQDIKSRFYLLPLRATHWFVTGTDPSKSRYLYIFIVAGTLILLLALINYMSLATAKATLRGKEIGVRKVIGADRSRIAWQFYVESALYVLIAFVVGIILFRLAQPYFFRHIELPIDASFLYQPQVLGTFAMLLLITILVSGAYPSMILSSYNPIAVLYGKLSKQKGGAGIRRFFIVMQFCISMGMIISSLIIEQQMNFFRHTDTGVNRENVLMVPFESGIGMHYQAFKNEVKQLQGIKQAAIGQFPMYGGYVIWGVTNEKDKEKYPLATLAGDDQFMSVLNMQWLRRPKTNSVFYNDMQIIINEAAISRLNLSPNPIGEYINLGADKLRIAGVVKNFNYASLHNKIDALALCIRKDSVDSWKRGGTLFIKIGPNVNIPTLIASVKKLYESYDQRTAFKFDFVDDAFNSSYKAEDRLAGIFSLFTGLMISIACLGLFGLVAFSVTQRTREIGIRKVLGASVRGIVVLLAKDFILYVFIAILIAIPVTFYAMNRWLENFAYKIDISWEIFSLAGAMTIILALLTISSIAIRAAKANPVKNLRTE